MSKKDYIALAEALIEARNRTRLQDIQGADDRQCAYWVAEHVLVNVADAIANVLARDNSAFDRERFLAAALRGEWTRAEGHNNRARKGA